MDGSGLPALLPERATVVIDGVRFRVQHFPFGPALRTGLTRVDVLVHGHTHEPSIAFVGHALLVNPGSARSGRHGHGETLAIVELGADGPTARLVEV